MIDLTDKWKKGELPECEYYIQDKDGNTSTMHLWNDERCKLSVRCKRLSILAPVPSYEEWQAKLEENTKLKELLKLAKTSVDYHCALCREYTDGQILLSKISQALGEE